MDKYKNTYANPIVLPDYPIGREGLDKEYNWRETADPSVLYEDGIWYLYSSCGMVYWTEDFVNWKHERMEPYDMGYAPTIVKHKGYYYICGSLSDLYKADNPKGPFVSIGAFKLPGGEKLPRCYDPMVFSDDDDRLFLYYSTGEPLILAVELDSDDPIQLLSEPEVMFRFNPDHIWERAGEYNEDGDMCAMEGPWMYKKNGIYYLTYGAPATEYSTYAMGAYKGKGPLGPWEYMKTNPFTFKNSGLVRGPGHGCVVDGPNDSIWAFYTTTICYQYHLERRIGFDPIYINEDGDLVCPEISENPRWAPGYVDDPVHNSDTGLVCVTGRRRPVASSCAPGRDPIYATDENLMSWWQPADDDEMPTLEIPIAPWGMNVCAMRILWRDVDLSLQHGNLPGPIKYKLEVTDDFQDGHEWVCVVDQSQNETDLVVDYRTFEAVRANRVKLTILGWPKGIKPGVMNISVFGWWTTGKK